MRHVVLLRKDEHCIKQLSVFKPWHFVFKCKKYFIFNEGIQRKKELIYFYWLISIVLRLWFSFLSTSTILQLRGPFRIEKICVLFFKLLKKGQKMFKPRIFLLSFQLKQAIAISRAINFQQVEAGLLRKG